MKTDPMEIIVLSLIIAFAMLILVVATTPFVTDREMIAMCKNQPNSVALYDKMNKFVGCAIHTRKE